MLGWSEMFKHAPGRMNAIDPGPVGPSTMELGVPGKRTLTEAISSRAGGRPLPGGQVGQQVAFQAAGEPHHLWIEMKEGQAVVMVASDPEMAVKAV